MRSLAWFLGGCVGIGSVLASGGCGLVLDASSHTDAHVEVDAAGIDARAPDDADLDAPSPALDAGLDVGPNVETDAAIDAREVEVDAPAPHDTGTVMSGDGYFMPDVGADAPLVTIDAFVPDAFVPDAFVPSIDAALPDARVVTCGMSNECPPSLDEASNQCRIPECMGGMCLATPYHTPCPPSGSCARDCAWSGATVTCRYVGSHCAPLLAPCTSTDQCVAGTVCRTFPCGNACVPITPCTDGMDCSFVSGAMAFMGTCADGACVPTAPPSWCLAFTP